MMVENRPSKKQRELLSFIDGFIKGNSYGPSYREIMRALDYKSVSTVAVHVDGLITRGLLYKKDHSARSLEVVKEQPYTTAIDDNGIKAHHTWLISVVETRLEQYEQGQESVARDDVAILIETLRIIGLKQAHAIMRDRLDTYQKKQ